MHLPKLVIGKLTLDLPIIQGGMGVGVSRAGLAAAVSAAGGLGVIASVGLGELEGEITRPYIERSRESLRKEIRKVKDQGLPVGVNIMVALTNYGSLVEVCVEEKVDAIISGAGLPLRLPGYAKDSSTSLIPIVSSGRATDIVCKTWLSKYNRLPDAFVVEGPMAGGHLGFKFDELENEKEKPLETLVQDVLAVAESYGKAHGKKIPVIAAGGIYTGQDIARFLRLGASGVQMGTRFVATHECDASIEYKQAFINSSEKDVIIIHSPVGMPARVINNAFVERSQRGVKSKFTCTYKCLITCHAKDANYCIAEVLLNACKGDFRDGFAMCGKNAYKIDKIVSVKELMGELVAGLRSEGYETSRA